MAAIAIWVPSTCSNIQALGKELVGVKKGGLPQPCLSSVSLPESRLEPGAWERSPVEGGRCSLKSDNRQVAGGPELWRCLRQIVGWHGSAGRVGCHERGG